MKTVLLRLMYWNWNWNLNFYPAYKLPNGAKMQTAGPPEWSPGPRAY